MKKGLINKDTVLNRVKRDKKVTRLETIQYYAYLVIFTVLMVGLAFLLTLIANTWAYNHLI